MNLFATWQRLYGLRYCPVTLLQIAFSAGTVYLLSAMQACSGGHIVQKDLQHALDQQELVRKHLQEIGRSWPGATKICEILMRLVEDHLTPLIEGRKAPLVDEKEDSASCGTTASFRTSANSNPIRGRTLNRRNRCGTIDSHKASKSKTTVVSISSEDSTSRTFMRSPPEETDVLKSPSASLAFSSVPINIPTKSNMESCGPSDFVYVSAGNSMSRASSTVSSKFDSATSTSFDQHSPPLHYFSDIAGLDTDVRHVRASNSLEHLEDLQAAASSPAISFLSGSPCDGFVCPSDDPPCGQMTFAPIWSQFTVGGYSTAPLAIFMGGNDDATTPPKWLNYPIQERGSSYDPTHSTLVTSSAKDKDACMEDLSQWIDLSPHNTIAM